MLTASCSDLPAPAHSLTVEDALEASSNFLDLSCLLLLLPTRLRMLVKFLATYWTATCYFSFKSC
jgi:hypothetical protein